MTHHTLSPWTTTPLGPTRLALVAVALLNALPSGAWAQEASPVDATSAEENVAFADTYQSQVEEVNGIRMHYVRGGEGPAVVLLHGWPTTWAKWRPVMPALADAGYTVIAPDLRGLGQTERPFVGYDSATLAEDIHQLVASLDLSEVHLVAHDIAGSPAYAYAATYPEEVTSLAMLDSIPAGIQPAGGGRGGGGEYWHLAFHGAAPDLAEALIVGQERLYLEHFFRTYAANPTAVTEAEINEFAAAYRQPGALRAGFAYYEAMAADAKAHQALAATPLPMPGLALGGETVGADGMLAAMRTVAPQAQGGVVAGAGHWLMHETPDEIANALIAFFQEAQP